MVLAQYAFLYNNPPFLMYLRQNPRWYKILYYDDTMFDAFLNEAKTNLGLTKVDTFKNISKKMAFMVKMVEYLVKK